tara:strand:+ start:830 stop:1447 length:618 start_codon:yes stop_codon:yes gene_type:complete
MAKGKTLIKTSGRTGSHLIMYDYELKGYTKKYSTDKQLFWEMEYAWGNKKYIVQEHKIEGFPTDVTEWELIYNYREDITSQITSSLIAKTTGVWRGKPEFMPTKLVFSDQEIKKEVMTHLVYKEFMAKAYKWNWKSRKKISMEKLLSDNNYGHLDRHKAVAYKDVIDNLPEHTVRVIESIIECEELAKAYALVKYDKLFGDGVYV